MAFLGTVLDQRVDRNDKESPGKTQCPQKNQHLKKSQSVHRDGERKCRHADGPERNKAVLDLSSRKKAGGIAPNANANGKSSLQITAARFIEMQNLAPVKNNHKLQQCAKKPEVSIAGNGEMQ